LLSVVLGRGTGSRLNRALVVQAGLLFGGRRSRESRDESLLYFSAALLPNADSTEVERRLLGGIGRLTAIAVGESELERAKRQLGRRPGSRSDLATAAGGRSGSPRAGC
jgi:predicted Zn-dependent peptidase